MRQLTVELKLVTRERLPTTDMKRYPELARLSGITVDLEQVSDDDLLHCMKQLNDFIQYHIDHFEDDELVVDVPLVFGTEVGFRGKRIGDRMKEVARRNGRCVKWAERRRERIIVCIAWQMRRDSSS